MINKLLVIIAAVVLCACGGASSSEKKGTGEKSVKEKAYKYASMKDGVLHLDLNEARKHPREVKLSEICDSLIYIPLETKKECLLGRNINRVEIDSDDVFIQEGWKLFHFDRSGKFIGQLGKTGRGPGEYVCGGFCLNKKEKKVYALANYKSKLLTFNYDGQLIDENIPLKNHPNNFVYNETDSSICSIYGYELMVSNIDNRIPKYSIIRESDMKGNIISNIKSKYFPKEFGSVKSKYSLSYGVTRMFKYEGDVYVQELANDTLFKYSNKRLEPRVVLNNSRYKPKFISDVFSKYINKIIEAKGDREEVLSLKDRNFEYNKVGGESSRYIFVGREERFVYDKYNRTLVCFDAIKSLRRERLSNDFDGLFDVRLNRIVNNQYILSIIPCSDFIEKYEDIIAEQKGSLLYKNRVKDIANTLSDESNPILILARLKK